MRKESGISSIRSLSNALHDSFLHTVSPATAKNPPLLMIRLSITYPNADINSILKQLWFILNQILNKIFIIHIFYPVSSLFNLFCQSAVFVFCIYFFKIKVSYISNHNKNILIELCKNQ